MNKPNFSPSSISTYIQCPYAKKLKDELNIKTEPTMAMREGLLFEGYLFGFKEGVQSQAEGSKKAAGLNFIQEQANFLKPIFKDGGQSFTWIETESKYWKLRGEIDYYGNVDIKLLSDLCGQSIDQFLSVSIVDVKYTSNIQKIWDAKSEREELLQSICYPYMIWKNTGEKVPFFYLLVDNQFQKPIVRVQQIFYTDYDFEYIERMLNICSNDVFFEPKISDDTCGGQRQYQSRCRYAEYCEHGRAFIGGYKQTIFK